MKIRLTAVLVIGLTLVGSPSIAAIDLFLLSNEECQSAREWCNDQCTSAMELEALRCSAFGPTATAAICHGINMARYGGCLAECRHV